MTSPAATSPPKPADSPANKTEGQGPSRNGNSTTATNNEPYSSGGGGNAVIFTLALGPIRSAGPSAFPTVPVSRFPVQTPPTGPANQVPAPFLTVPSVGIVLAGNEVIGPSGVGIDSLALRPSAAFKADAVPSVEVAPMPRQATVELPAVAGFDVLTSLLPVAGTDVALSVTEFRACVDAAITHWEEGESRADWAPWIIALASAGATCELMRRALEQRNRPTVACPGLGPVP